MIKRRDKEPKSRLHYQALKAVKTGVIHNHIFLSRWKCLDREFMSIGQATGSVLSHMKTKQREEREKEERSPISAMHRFIVYDGRCMRWEPSSPGGPYNTKNTIPQTGRADRGCDVSIHVYTTNLWWSAELRLSVITARPNPYFSGHQIQ